MSLQKKNTGIEILKCGTSLEAIQKGSQLSKLKREFGMNAIITVLSQLIIEFQENLNISEKMNNNQILQCSELILKEYWGYKIEEFKIMFDDALMNKYGKVYNRLDAPTIFKMIQEYDSFREQELVLNHQKKKQPITTENNNEIPEVIRSKIAALEKKTLFDYNDPEYKKFKSEEYQKGLKNKK